MDDCQHSKPLVRKPASGVIDLSQITVAAFDSGRGPLKGLNPLLSPLAPLGQVVLTELLGKCSCIIIFILSGIEHDIHGANAYFPEGKI